MRKISLLTPLLAAGAILIPTAAWAQGAEGEAAPPAEPPAAETAPMEAPPAEPPPAEAPPPAPEPVAEATAEMPAEAPAAEAAPAEEEDAGVPSWMRVDSDALTLQLWFGATHDVGGVGIATDIYVDSGYWGEFDIGVEIPIGEGVLLIPMAGIAMDWGNKKFQSLVAPQLFGYFTFDPIYAELWSQMFFNSIFADPGYTQVGDDEFIEIKETVPDFWYNRLYLTYAVTENFRIGPQVEATVALNDAAKITDDEGNPDKALTSLQVGGHIDLGYGEGNTLGLFLGYETVKESRTRLGGDGAPLIELDENGDEVGPMENGIVGRLTFIRYF
ncbi:MAG TPA: hypothetical protein VI197_03345 [Polyangiaceae bacterium]